MFVLLFLLTGSIVMPLKALALNILSLTAAFGAMVWIFQDGHLGALGTTDKDAWVANIPARSVLRRVRPVDGLRGVPGIADREIGGCPRGWPYAPTTTKSVACWIAHTGRIITAAALIMSISFAALIAAHVAVMRMFGVGLTLAVLVDATLAVRMVLVPAFMHVMENGIGGALGWMVGVHLTAPVSATGPTRGANEIPNRYRTDWIRAPC